MIELEQRFAEALHAAARAWRQAVDRRLKASGMSQASWTTMSIAAKARTPLSQSELAGRLGVEGATIVAMVDRLVKAGWVERQASQSDRRINRIIVTEAGARVAEEVKADADAVRRELLAQIDQRELAVATGVLETLLRLMQESPRQAPAAAFD